MRKDPPTRFALDLIFSTPMQPYHAQFENEALIVNIEPYVRKFAISREVLALMNAVKTEDAFRRAPVSVVLEINPQSAETTTRVTNLVDFHPLSPLDMLACSAESFYPAYMLHTKGL